MDMVHAPSHTCTIKCNACGRVYGSNVKEPEVQVCPTCERLIKLGLETEDSIRSQSKWNKN